jgi:endonuclease/exonuclease/phosphatase family metal-dependent hydrolase
MQRFVLLFLLAALNACTDSGSPAPRPQLPDAPAQQPLPEPTPTQDPVPPPNDDAGRTNLPLIGADQSFEFGTWNIQNFPKSSRAVDITSDVIKQTAVDLMALEEVSNEVAFQQLVDELPGFAAVLSPHEYNSDEYQDQKLAFIYREADLELVAWELLFTKQTYIFPRPPLQAHFKIKTGSRAGQDIYMIAVHLKAYADGQKLREDANKAQAPGAQVALLGDFNEQVTRPAGLKVFQPWLDKPDAYTFQTKELALTGDYTYISNNRSMIDHMISTRNIELNPITIPKLETMIPSYRDLVSDHLPVMARLR